MKLRFIDIQSQKRQSAISLLLVFITITRDSVRPNSINRTDGSIRLFGTDIINLILVKRYIGSIDDAISME